MLMGLFGPRVSKGQQYHGLRDDFCERLDIFIIISIVFLAQGLSRVKDGLLVTEVDLTGADKLRTAGVSRCVRCKIFCYL